MNIRFLRSVFSSKTTMEKASLVRRRTWSGGRRCKFDATAVRFGTLISISDASETALESPIKNDYRQGVTHAMSYLVGGAAVQIRCDGGANWGA